MRSASMWRRRRHHFTPRASRATQDPAAPAGHPLGDRGWRPGGLDVLALCTLGVALLYAVGYVYLLGVKARVMGGLEVPEYLIPLRMQREQYLLSGAMCLFDLLLSGLVCAAAAGVVALAVVVLIYWNRAPFGTSLRRALADADNRRLPWWEGALLSAVAIWAFARALDTRRGPSWDRLLLVVAAMCAFGQLCGAALEGPVPSGGSAWDTFRLVVGGLTVTCCAALWLASGPATRAGWGEVAPRAAAGELCLFVLLLGAFVLGGASQPNPGTWDDVAITLDAPGPGSQQVVGKLVREREDAWLVSELNPATGRVVAVRVIPKARVLTARVSWGTPDGSVRTEAAARAAPTPSSQAPRGRAPAGGAGR